MQLFEMFSYEKPGVSTKSLVTSPNRGFKKGRFPRCTVLGGCGSSAHEVLTMFQQFTFPRKHASPTELPWREVNEQHNPGA